MVGQRSVEERLASLETAMREVIEQLAHLTSAANTYHVDPRKGEQARNRFPIEVRGDQGQ